MPRSPSAPILRHRSAGKRLSRSIAAARGAISSAANARTLSRSMSMLSPSLKSSMSKCAIRGSRPPATRGAGGALRALARSIVILYDVYVNVNLTASTVAAGARPAFPVRGSARLRSILQLPPAFALDAVHLRQRGVDVVLLLHEARAAVGEQLDELRELAALVARHLVHVEQAGDFGQRESQTLAAQDQLEAHALALAVNAHAADALRCDQPFVLVEADGARGQREFLRQGGNRIGRRARRHVGSSDHRRVQGAVSKSRYHMHRRVASARRSAPPPMNAPLHSELDYPFAAAPPVGDSMRVAPGITWLRMALPFALDHINLWLCDSGDRVAAVAQPQVDVIERERKRHPQPGDAGRDTHRIADRRRGGERVVEFAVQGGIHRDGRAPASGSDAPMHMVS